MSRHHPRRLNARVHARDEGAPAGGWGRAVRQAGVLTALACACLPHGTRAPEGACPGPEDALIVYPGAEDVTGAGVELEHRVPARFDDVVAFYRACYGAREYPFRTRARVSFRLQAPPPTAPPTASAPPRPSRILILERRASATIVRVECHDC